MLHHSNELEQKLTSGVKRNLIPFKEPFRVNPRIRKMVSTTKGRVEVTYTALRKKSYLLLFSIVQMISAATVKQVLYLPTGLNTTDDADIKYSPRTNMA